MQYTLEHILDIFGSFFIRGIFISVIVILIAKRIFGNRIETNISMQFIRWIMLGYSFLVIVNFILLLTFEYKEEYLLYLNDPSAISFLMASAIVPLILLFKNYSRSAFCILLISVIINYAWIMESIVIHIPSIFRGNYRSLFPFKFELLNLFKGFIVGLIILIINNSIKKYKATKVDIIIKERD